MIDEIKTLKFKKANSHRAKGGPGKTCSKCSTSHPLRECPACGKKCHKCGNKNHFSMCCRTRDREDSQDRDQHRLTHRESQKAKVKAGAGVGDMHQRTWRIDLDPTPEVPTAYNKSPFKTILNPMVDIPLKVMILLRRHFTLFPGQSWWLASEIRQIQMAKPRSHNSEHQITTLKWHRKLVSQSWCWCRG